MPRGAPALPAVGVRGDWSRRYPPLIVMAVALALAILTLPSALNLPQANPSQTLEYAPVPGDNGQAPPGGSLAALGLGSEANGPGEGTAGNGQEDVGGLLAPPPPAGDNPSTKRCVGNPPRQTEDPFSPPCVAFFSGPNGGATAVGVTATEINVVFRFVSLTANCYPAAETPNCGPPTGLYDIDNPGDVSKFFMWHLLKDWETYFNDRYQLYNRRAHFYAYNFGDTQGYAANGYGPKDAQAEASQIWSKIHPFATVDLSGLQADSFSTYLANKGTVQFGAASFTEPLAHQYPGQYWAYPPSPARRAEMFATYVCTKIVQPGRVSFSGNNDTDQPRHYGLLLSDDTERPATRTTQELAVQAMKRHCGITFDDTEYFHYTGADSASGPRSGWGVPNMVTMRSKNVTTVIWPGGMEGEDMAGADRIKWYPEWVVLGDGITEGNQSMDTEPKTEASHVYVTTSGALLNAYGTAVEKACYDAILEVDPQLPRTDMAYACNGQNSPTLFVNTRQMFIGLQLSGPALTAANIDGGFHAIPARPSTGPDHPSCYYEVSDYSCVKDAAAEWFDTNTPCGSGQGSATGCYRMWRNGARFRPGEWPPGDAAADHHPNDIINLYTTGVSTNVRPT